MVTLKDARKKKPRSSSPSRPRASTLTPSASPLDGDLVADHVEATAIGLFDDLQISQSYPDSSSNPRSFPYNVKQKCWDKAEKVKGRDPDRWRRDAVGNIVFRKLVGCPGCLCHDYDHILPYSKGGQSTLDNCQVLQSDLLISFTLAPGLLATAEDRLTQNNLARVNRSKGNRTELSKSELIQKSSYCRVSGREMDLIELSAYGNVRHAEDTGGCRIQ